MPSFIHHDLKIFFLFSFYSFYFLGFKCHCKQILYKIMQERINYSKEVQLVFSSISGQSRKDNQDSKRLFNLLIDYLKSSSCIFEHKSSILKNLPTTSNLQKLEKCASVAISYQCSYGCAVLFTKEDKDRPIKLEIVVPEGWISRSNSLNSERIQEVNPKRYNSISFPLIQNYTISLSEFATKMEKELQSFIAQSSSRHNLQDIQKAITSALRKSGQNLQTFTTVYTRYDLQAYANNQNYQPNLEYIGASAIQFKNSKANTAWHIIQALLRRLITSKKGDAKATRLKTEQLIIGFKGYLLEKATQKKGFRDRIGFYKICLDDLIFHYKHYVSSQSSKILKKFNQMVQKILKNIHQQMGGSLLTTKILQNTQIKQLQLSRQRGSIIVNIPKPVVSSNLQSKKVDVNFFPFEVQRRKPFDQLLDLYDEANLSTLDAEKKESLVNQWILLVQHKFFQLSSELCDDKLKRRKSQAIDLGICPSEIEANLKIPNILKVIEKYEEIVEKDYYKYGMGMQSQALSHIALLRMIGCAVTFQIVKYKRQKCNQNLNDYRIPIEIQQVYTYFYSLNTEARSAMINMNKYHQRTLGRRKLFVLDGGTSSFQEFAVKVAQENRDTKHFYSQACGKVSWTRDQDRWVYSFLHSTPYDIFGLMKMSFFAQFRKSNQYQHSNHILVSSIFDYQMPLIIRTYQKNGISFIRFRSNNQLMTPVQESHFLKLFENYNKDDVENFIRTPNNLRNREHSTYAYDNKRYGPADLNQEIFHSEGVTRSTLNTQLLVLCQNIFGKKVKIDCFSRDNVQSLFGEEVFLHTAGHLMGYNKQIENRFKKGQKLLRQMQDKIWEPSYKRYIHIFAPFLSSIGQHINEFNPDVKSKQVLYEISKKILESLKMDQQENPRQKIAWQQKFLCLGAILCFREEKLDKNQDCAIIQHLTLLILLYREFKIRAEREAEQKPNKMRDFDRIMNFALEKTIHNNIEQISSYMIQNQQKFGSIVKKIHKHFPQQCSEWTQCNTYHFKCQANGITYEIDLYRGNYYVNGKLQFGLNPEIKENKHFKKIFGNHRSFAVMEVEEGYVQTKNCINASLGLKKQEGTSSSFRFSRNGKIIEYCVKYRENDEQKKEIWELLPYQGKNKAENFNFSIPAVFKENYLPWINRKDNCIVFRGNSYEKNLKQIGLVIHLKKEFRELQDSNEIQTHNEKAFYINNKKKQRLQSLQEMKKIYDRSNPLKYPQLILRKQNKQQLFAYKILSKLEQPEYILQLQESNGKKYLELHRLNIGFEINDKNKQLISQDYYGYSIEYGHLEKNDCLFNKFDCLVLKKDPTNINVMNSHNNILLLSLGNNVENGKIHKPKGSLEQIPVFKYDIHDHLGDIRGTTRAHQMYLANVFLSINDNMKIRQIQMTPLQYAIYLLKSCLTDTPLSLTQIPIFSRIIKTNSEQVLLVCKALWKTFHFLQQFFSFYKKDRKGSKQNGQYNKILQKEKNQRRQIQDLQIQMMRNERKTNNAQLMLNNGIQDQTIRYNQLLDGNMARLLVFNENKFGNFIDYNETNECSSDESSIQDVQYIVNKSKKSYWIQQKEETGAIIHKNMSNITILFNKVNQTDRQLQEKLPNHDNPQINETDQQFINKIEQICQLHKNTGQMIQDKVSENKNSYQAYLKQKKNDQSLNELIMNPEVEGVRGVKQLISQLKLGYKQLVQQIDKIFDNLRDSSEVHGDIITGFRPTFSKLYFTKILCSKYKLKYFFPHMSKQALEDLRWLIKVWMGAKTRLESMCRLQIIMREEGDLDILAIQRQIKSPRVQFFSNQTEQSKKIQQNLWICFEVEMKVQARYQQYKVYEHLKNLSSEQKLEDYVKGFFCQLNMGEGKTQVIIPMLVLSKIYCTSHKKIPRINLLSSLFEEAKGNFFRFLSVTGFRVPGIEIPYTRDVKLNKQDNRLNLTNIIKARYFLKCFNNNYYILMSRQSRLSEILCYQQYSTIKNFPNITMKKQPIIGEDEKMYDIFDEIDEVMNPNKSYIYSVGEPQNLQHLSIRLKITKLCLEIFLKNIVSQKEELFQNRILIADESFQKVENDIAHGRYPAGLRLIQVDQNACQIQELWKQLIDQILTTQEFLFFQNISSSSQKQIKKYILDSSQKCQLIHENMEPVLVLRGLFAFDIFSHCLSIRCGVRFGVPGIQHEKNIAVPYESANTPSKTSQFEHPQVSIIFTYISYYIKGIKFQHFRQCVKKLKQDCSQVESNTQYNRWISLCSQVEGFRYRQAKDIEESNEFCLEEMYKVFKYNWRTISFWLQKCVFPQDLKHFQKSLIASGSDLAAATQSIGFSGTNENKEILPSQIKYQQPEDPNIKATDGKMIYLMSCFARQFKVIDDNDEVLWKRFINKVLDNEREIGCIIDAGALCVGKSLRQDIVPWIADKFDENRQKYAKYKGISFCDEDGKWKVFNLETKNIIDRGTTIPDYQTFAIFDEARSRGADLNLDSRVVAALSLGPKMTKDKLMQAAGRLRKLGRRQSITLIATHEVTASILQILLTEQRNQYSLQNLPPSMIQYVIAWCIINSVCDNQNLLIQSAKLSFQQACIQLNNNLPRFQKMSKSLSAMYKQSLERQTIEQITNNMLKIYSDRYYNIENLQQKTEIEKIKQKLKKYGKQIVKQVGSVDNICEREVQKAQQNQREQKKIEHLDLQAIDEDDTITTMQTEIPGLNHLFYHFSDAFKYSKNWALGTRNKQDQVQQGKYSKLPLIYFVKVSTTQVMLISLREADKLLTSNRLSQNQKIYLLSDLQELSFKSTVLNKAKLSCLFVAGRATFSDSDQEYLYDFMHITKKKLQQSDKFVEYQDILGGVLTKRNTFDQRYSHSSLQCLQIYLKNKVRPSSGKISKEIMVQAAC